MPPSRLEVGEGNTGGRIPANSRHQTFSFPLWFVRRSILLRAGVVVLSPGSAGLGSTTPPTRAMGSTLPYLVTLGGGPRPPVAVVSAWATLAEEARGE